MNFGDAEETKTEENASSTHGSNGNTRFKPGQSISWFARKAIDHSQTLLGNRYLCRGGGMLIIAPSGLGKSTLSIQLAIELSAGCQSFGIQPARPLRILIIQAEDDEGDCIEMSMMISHLGLKDNQIKLVEQNTCVIRCNNLSGKAFIDALELQLAEAKEQGKAFDIVIINPYSTYMGGDIQGFRDNVTFLNHLLNPVLTKFEVGAIIIAHTPKANYLNFDNLNPWDFQYLGAGSAAITNWARSILVLAPQKCDLKLFMFVAAKRGGRIGPGWEDLYTRYFSHADKGEAMRWKEASPEQKTNAGQSNKKKEPPVEDVIQICMPSLVEWITKSAFIINAKQSPWELGENKAEHFLRVGIEKDLIEFEERPRPRTNPEKFYRRRLPCP